jgi:hypothetical protein
MKTLHAILSAAIVALAMSATTALSDHELVRAFNITSEVIALRLLQEAKERGAYVFSYEWLWDDNKVMPIDTPLMKETLEKRTQDETRDVEYNLTHDTDPLAPIDHLLPHQRLPDSLEMRDLEEDLRRGREGRLLALTKPARLRPSGAHPARNTLMAPAARRPRSGSTRLGSSPRSPSR